MTIIGVDEAGRGPLAGSVVAAAVAFPANFYLEGLTDSKKLTEKKREDLYSQITEQCYWSVAEASNIEIDEISVSIANNSILKTMLGPDYRFESVEGYTLGELQA